MTLPLYLIFWLFVLLGVLRYLSALKPGRLLLFMSIFPILTLMVYGGLNAIAIASKTFFLVGGLPPNRCLELTMKPDSYEDFQNCVSDHFEQQRQIIFSSTSFDTLWRWAFLPDELRPACFTDDQEVCAMLSGNVTPTKVYPRPAGDVWVGASILSTLLAILLAHYLHRRWYMSTA
ncbi:MAG: hypothetical protein IT320_10390 [Anaerolineae bacterium]|nr:hypothetical protein [Anaerolineae bacterium]